MQLWLLRPRFDVLARPVHPWTVAVCLSVALVLAVAGARQGG